MRSSHFLLTATAALALAACADSGADTAGDTAAGTGPDTTTMNEEAATAEAAAAPGANAPTDPQGFVDQAAASDMYEIEAGKLAQANGKSQAVKDFGAMMERDHTKSSADLKTAAASAQADREAAV